MRSWRNRQTRAFEGRMGDRVGSSPTDRTKYADMAELADAHGSGPCESNFMGVQVPSSAPKEQYPFGCCSFFVFDVGLEGRVLENSPVDCFPAPPLRPQTGKSLHPHQSPCRKTRTFFFSLNQGHLQSQVPFCYSSAGSSILK